ncbi:MAG: hypothetical protein WB684_02475, partial [Gaiella sp.]
MTVLAYLEHVDGAVDEPSLQAATLALSLAEGAEAHAVAASNAASLALDGAPPVGVVHLAVH